MIDSYDYYVVLFDSVNHAMKSEKILKSAGIPHKIIPVPRHLGSNCGICIRFLHQHRMEVENELVGKIEFYAISHL